MCQQNCETCSRLCQGRAQWWYLSWSSYGSTQSASLASHGCTRDKHSAAATASTPAEGLIHWWFLHSLPLTQRVCTRRSAKSFSRRATFRSDTDCTWCGKSRLAFSMHRWTASSFYWCYSSEKYSWISAVKFSYLRKFIYFQQSFLIFFLSLVSFWTLMTLIQS